MWNLFFFFFLKENLADHIHGSKNCLLYKMFYHLPFPIKAMKVSNCTPRSLQIKGGSESTCYYLYLLFTCLHNFYVSTTIWFYFYSFVMWLVFEMSLQRPFSNCLQFQFCDVFFFTLFPNWEPVFSFSGGFVYLLFGDTSIRIWFAMEIFDFIMWFNAWIVQNLNHPGPVRGND